MTVTNPGNEPLEVTFARDDGALATNVVEPATPELPATVTAYEVVDGGTSTVTVSVPDDSVEAEDGASTVLATATSTHDCSPAASVCDEVLPFEPPAAEGTLPCPEPETDPGTVPSDPVDPGTGETDVPPVAAAPPADDPGTDAAMAATGESDFGAQVLALAQVTQPDLPPPPPPSSGSIVGPATDPEPAPDGESVEQAPAPATPDDPALATTGSSTTTLLRLASALLLLGFALLGASRWTNRARRPARRFPSRMASTAATCFAAVLPRPDLTAIRALDAAPTLRLIPPLGPPGRLASPATG